MWHFFGIKSEIYQWLRLRNNDDLSIFSSKRESKLLDTIPKLPQAGINDPLRSYQSPNLVLSSLIKELQLTWIAIMINYNVLFIVQTHGSNVIRDSSQGSAVRGRIQWVYRNWSFGESLKGFNFTKGHWCRCKWSEVWIWITGTKW